MSWLDQRLGSGTLAVEWTVEWSGRGTHWLSYPKECMYCTVLTVLYWYCAGPGPHPPVLPSDTPTIPSEYHRASNDWWKPITAFRFQRWWTIEANRDMIGNSARDLMPMSQNGALEMRAPIMSRFAISSTHDSPYVCTIPPYVI